MPSTGLPSFKQEANEARFRFVAVASPAIRVCRSYPIPDWYLRAPGNVGRHAVAQT